MTDVAINQETKGFQTSAILRVASVASTYLLAVYIAHTFIKYLPFKFAPAADVNPIFKTLEAWSGLSWVEPDFRFFTGGVETLAAVLLFVLGLQLIAALLTLGITGTAFLLHLAPSASTASTAAWRPKPPSASPSPPGLPGYAAKNCRGWSARCSSTAS